MQLIRGQLQLSHSINQSVVTLGNFDGVHIGHQQLLSTLKNEAERLNIPKVVITFEPPPRQYFHRLNFPRLMHWQEKWLALRDNKIDYLVCLHFAQQLASMSAVAFVTDILVAQLGVRSLIVGDDFRFGAKRAGTIHLLQELSQQHGFRIIKQPSYNLDGQRVSSTRIRQALSEGNVELANRLLGRPYYLYGRVVHGDKRGAQLLQMPTANIDLRKKPVPLSGIFVVTVTGITPAPLPGVASVGVRPMFDGKSSWLEVHLLDFNQSIYGRKIQINFLHKLRDESCFASVEALMAQMQQDAADARHFLMVHKEVRP